MISCAILGYGNRGSIYADELFATQGVRIASICDINPENLKRAKEKYSLPEEVCFTDENAFFSQKRADCIVIATMDKLHVGQVLRALRLGYDILLEKPIATTLEDCDAIEREAAKYDRKILICHVLRYTPFFKKIKELIDRGDLGEITSVSESENIAFVHYWLSFLHGNWHNSGKSSPIILQKCCHDFDIISWLLGKRCEKVSSFGNLKVYKRENVPQDAAKYCCECKEVDTCIYSGIRIMKKQPAWLQGYYPDVDMTNEEIERILSDKRNPFSGCAFLNDNNVMTDQIVNLWYEGGIPVQHLMSGFSAEGRREITVHAAKGEIFGYMGAEKVKVFYRPFQQQETVFDLSEESNGSNHGGGDKGIIHSFIRYLETGENRGDLSTLSDSLMSHRIAFAAEKSRLESGKVIVL